MHEHGYDQLPVSNEKGFAGQVVTFESILQASQSFRTGVSLLAVRDVARRARTYQSDADLLATLDDIHRDNFALIVSEGKLAGIVTTADVAVFFREYAQDLLQIEGIETRVKEAILALYASDRPGLEAAITKASDRGAQIRKRVPGAIRAYLRKQNISSPPLGTDSDALMEAEKTLGLSDSSKKFEDLSFDEFSTILLLHPFAPKPSQAKDTSELRVLLEQVRDARNGLAHFRGELAPNVRQTVQFAAEWLDNNLPQNIVDSVSTSQVTFRPVQAQDEESAPQGSYSLLAGYLQALQADVSSITMTFEDIEGILKKGLPRSASEYRAWWSNDPTKPQSAAWLDEGWRTSAINMTDRRLTFSRTSDREDAYINFFAKLNSRLGRGSGLQWRLPSPQGQSWHILASLDKSRPEAANVVASFTRKKRFRIELYIDYADKELNKRFFDNLFSQRGQIEGHFGEPLEWERLDDRRASRIAIYTKAQIFSDVDNILLIDWAAKRAEQFRSIFERFFPSL